MTAEHADAIALAIAKVLRALPRKLRSPPFDIGLTLP
jgi:hypothetical protein